MAQVKFTPNLRRYFPDLCDCAVEAATVADIISAVNQRWTGLGDYIIDERGCLRKHVNIFVGDQLLKDKVALSDSVAAETRVIIVQALSGG
ncbi:MAG: molybdenum cofactor biosynthesis protein MoaD [Chloroflexi bacterium]|nr:molybdenum cofactor biosynthesis protein MoaD [Chloroflexota bacterium]